MLISTQLCSNMFTLWSRDIFKYVLFIDNKNDITLVYFECQNIYGLIYIYFGKTVV